MGCTMLGEKEVKTRKKHYCSGCIGDIPVGSVVDTQTFVWDNRVVTVYTHRVCAQIASIILEDRDNLNCDDMLDEDYVGMINEYTFTKEQRAEIDILLDELAQLKIDQDNLDKKD